MNLVRIGILVVALAIAGAVALLISNYLESRGGGGQQVVTQRIPTVQVLVAARDLPAGKVLLAGELEGDVRWQAWPEDGVAKNWIIARDDSDETSPQSVLAKQDIGGAVVKRGLTEGEPVTLDRLVKPGAGAFMAALLKPGQRAVTIPINPVSGNAGFILPGSNVDIVLTQRDDERDPVTGETRSRVASEVVLSNIKVLAIDQNVNDMGTLAAGGKTATLEVSPKQFEQVEVAKSLGTLSLALRSLQAPKTPPPPDPFTSELEVSRFLTRNLGAATPILTARTALKKGTLLTDADMQWTTAPEGMPLEGLLVRGRFNETGLRGSLLMTDLGPGEPIKEEDIIKPGTQGFLTAAIRPGLRAVSISVSPVSAVSGYISPGDRVDILLTHSITDNSADAPKNPRQFSETIMRDVRVLAIEQHVDESSGKPVLGGTATLEVSPKQAESLFVAASMGDLSLVLKRREADTDETASRRPFTSDLEVSRAEWEMIRGLNRYGPGLPPKPQTVAGLKVSQTVAEKPEPTPPPPELPAAPAPVRSSVGVKKQTVIKVYRSVGVSTVTVAK